MVEKPNRKPRKQVVCISIDPDALNELDDLAARLGRKRSSLVQEAVDMLLEATDA